MPCSATITARGLPWSGPWADTSAFQWRNGSFVPPRATSMSAVICGITPASIDGANVGAQAQSNTREKAGSQRTSSHLQVLRQGVFVAQHQHADNQQVIDAVRLLAERQGDAFIIEKLCPRHVQPRPAAIA